MIHSVSLMCAVFMDVKMGIDNEAEEIGLCKSFKDFKRECIKVGEQRGIAIGEGNALRSFIRNLLDKSYSMLDICSLTGASEEKV